jgi:hypothetical protein
MLCRLAGNLLEREDDDQEEPTASLQLVVPRYSPFLNRQYLRLAHWSSSPNITIRSFALQGIGYLALRAPQFLAAHLPFFNAALQEGTSVLQCGTLNVLLEMMKQQQASALPTWTEGDLKLRLEYLDQHAINIIEPDSATTPIDEKLRDEQFQDSCVLASVSQQLLPALIHLFRAKDTKVRHLVMTTVSMGTRTRMFSPVDLIPSLMMTANDHVETLAAQAQSLLAWTAEKYRNFLIPRLIAGMRAAFQAPNPAPRSALQPVYELVAPISNQRRQLFKVLLDSFRTDSHEHDLAFIRFLTEALLRLLPRFSDDPIFLVSAISQLIPVDASAVLLAYKGIKKDAESATPAVLATAAKLSYLMVLKSAWQQHYSITEARLQAFDADTAASEPLTAAGVSPLDADSNNSITSSLDEIGAAYAIRASTPRTLLKLFLKLWQQDDAEDRDDNKLTDLADEAAAASATPLPKKLREPARTTKVQITPRSTKRVIVRPSAPPSDYQNNRPKRRRATLSRMSLLSDSDDLESLPSSTDDDDDDDE